MLSAINATDPLLRQIFADGGHAGPRLKGALARIGRWTLQIDKRSDPAPGFELLPRRRVVERTFAGLDRCRRMAKDRAKPIAPAKAWLRIAHIRRRIRVPQENDIIQRVSNRTFRPGRCRLRNLTGKGRPSGLGRGHDPDPDPSTPR